VLWPIWILAAERPGTAVGIGLSVLLYPLVVIAAGAIGKVAGIVAGRSMHRRLRRQLAHRLTALIPTAEP
jgi:hypothetical protein